MAEGYNRKENRPKIKNETVWQVLLLLLLLLLF